MDMNSYITEKEKILGACFIFADEMQRKMMKKLEQIGLTGWDNPENMQNFLTGLNHKMTEINNGSSAQFIDAANYLMMMHYCHNKLIAEEEKGDQKDNG